MIEENPRLGRETFVILRMCRDNQFQQLFAHFSRDLSETIRKQPEPRTTPVVDSGQRGPMREASRLSTRPQGSSGRTAPLPLRWFLPFATGCRGIC